MRAVCPKRIAALRTADYTEGKKANKRRNRRLTNPFEKTETAEMEGQIDCRPHVVAVLVLLRGGKGMAVVMVQSQGGKDATSGSGEGCGDGSGAITRREGGHKEWNKTKELKEKPEYIS
ncbi:hypothetical protein NL676_019750 [Syzygium grande]|nr:hypothetical protein NL676_019750 [Syzygium grande]